MPMIEQSAPLTADEQALLDAWRARSVAGGWTRPDLWWVPEVSACVRARYDLGDLAVACERLARSRAEHATGFDEALTDLDSLWNELALVDAPPDFVRLFTVAWSNARALVG